MIILDTNVVSELRKSPARINPAVAAWVGCQHPDDLYLSVISIEEIEIGIGRKALTDPVQAQILRSWLEDQVIVQFADRIVPVSLEVARIAGQLHVASPRPERDALIAATALAHRARLATRNVKDFEPLGAPIINPWQPASA